MEALIERPSPTMRVITFNVNGVRSLLGKSKNGAKDGTAVNNCLTTLIAEQQPDVLCLQEVKTQNAGDLSPLHPHFPHRYTNFATNRKGYSGVALLSKQEPEWVSLGFSRYPEEVIGEYEDAEFNQEGRLIAAKFPSCVVVTMYVPNAKPELARIEERIQWEELVREYLGALREEVGEDVPIMVMGDFNICPARMDVHRAQPKNTPGASQEEMDQFAKLKETGYVDAFRALYPDRVKFTYWSNFGNARANNKGWRIDLAMVSAEHMDRVLFVDCLTDYHGSDHCPVLCDME
jgi:exodeoxyribonuclease-3